MKSIKKLKDDVDVKTEGAVILKLLTIVCKTFIVKVLAFLISMLQ